MEKFDLIIFDCDGTLVDSEGLNNLATRQIFAEEGLVSDQDYALSNWMGKTVANIVLSVQMETGKILPPDIGERYIKRCTELQSGGLQPVPGAPDFVDKARARFKTCVASNGERVNVLRSLEITGLMPFFTEATVFTKVQVKNPKPYPDLFLFAASHMDADPARTLVIEDSGTGVTAGVAAGMTVWGFTGTSHNPDLQKKHLEEAGATRVFTSLIHMMDELGL